MSEEPLTGRHRPTPKAKAAPAADPKRPYHVGVAIGLTTGLYAATLLVTARLQIAQDRDLIEDRTPVEAAISSLDDHHDWMNDRLEEARAQYAIGTTGYDALRAQLASLDKRLTNLDQMVDRLEQLGASLPVSLDLPGVPTTSRSSSGGGKSSSGQSGSGGSKPKPPPAPPPPAAPPPPTGGTSGASGGP